MEAATRAHNGLSLSGNGMVRYSPEPAERAYTEIELRDAVADVDRHVNATDVLDQLTDAEEVLERAIQARDEALIGKLVLGVRDAYVCRLAARVLYATEEHRQAFAPESVE